MARKKALHVEGGAEGPVSLLPRPINWVGSSKDDISALPDPVKASFGYRLRQVQEGGTPLDMKRLPQFGSGVIELRERYDRNAYRLIYVVNLKKAIYVLHAFMKKSKSGIGIPKPDAGLIEEHLKGAQALERRTQNMAETPVHKSSGNVFADMGFTAAEAAELTAKSRLIMAIGETIKRRKLTQLEAARRCGTDQPSLSKVLRGRMESVTIDRLAAWLTALGRTVEIRVRPYDAKARKGQLVTAL